MATIKQPTTKIVETLKIGKDIKDAKALATKIGRALGSPINSKEVGEEFDVTLTGNIEIREFNGQKGAYFTTVQGFSIRVNASFDPAKHKEGVTLKAVCREFPRENGTAIKFCALVD